RRTPPPTRLRTSNARHQSCRGPLGLLPIQMLLIVSLPQTHGFSDCCAPRECTCADPRFYPSWRARRVEASVTARIGELALTQVSTRAGAQDAWKDGGRALFREAEQWHVVVSTGQTVVWARQRHTTARKSER